MNQLIITVHAYPEVVAAIPGLEEIADKPTVGTLPTRVVVGEGGLYRYNFARFNLPVNDPNLPGKMQSYPATKLYIGNGTLLVRETPEEVDALIIMAQYKIREEIKNAFIDLVSGVIGFRIIKPDDNGDFGGHGAN